MARPKVRKAQPPKRTVQQTGLPIPPAPPALIEAGRKNLKAYHGQVQEEFHPDLRGSKRAKAFREMFENDPVAAGVKGMFKLVAGQVERVVEPASETLDAQRWAHFYDTICDDMDHTWQSYTQEALDHLIEQGWVWHEIVAKIRGGDEYTDPVFRSKYRDGMFGLRALSIRDALTVDPSHGWEFDANEHLIGLRQSSEPDFVERYNPRPKAVHVTIGARKGNPEGRSVGRGMIRPWLFLRDIEVGEAIGILRDMVGMPVMEVPPEMLATAAADPASPEATALASYKEMVTQIRQDRLMGAVVPATETSQGKTGYNFRLLGSPGSKTYDSDKVIRRHQSRMLMAANMDVINIGQEGVGTQALARVKMGAVEMAVDALLSTLYSQINLDLVPFVGRLNNIPRSCWPRIWYGQIKAKNMVEFSTSISSLLGAGALTAGDDIERASREYLELPAMQPEIVDEKPDPEPPPPPPPPQVVLATPAAPQPGIDGEPQQRPDEGEPTQD